MVRVRPSHRDGGVGQHEQGELPEEQARHQRADAQRVEEEEGVQRQTSRHGHDKKPNQGGGPGSLPIRLPPAEEHDDPEGGGTRPHHVGCPVGQAGDLAPAAAAAKALKIVWE